MKNKGLLIGAGVLISMLVGVIALLPLLFGVFATVITPIEKTSTKCSPSITNTSENKDDLINVPAEYVEDVKKAAEEAGLPVEIIAKQIQQESNWDPNAVSPKGAKGLTQFIPSTWEAIAPGEDPFDPHASIAAQGRYMKQLKDQVQHLANGDANQIVKLTLAAYNAGPGAVLSYGGIPPYSETEHYVEIITSGAQVNFSATCSQVDGAKAWDGDLGTGEWTNPCPGCSFTSGYGQRNLPPGFPDWMRQHVGVDLATPGLGQGQAGVEIITPTDMTVVGMLADDGCVIAKQNEAPGFQFGFCHLNTINVTVGQNLKRGDIIGIEGGTGGGRQFAFATHLHFEIYDPESPVPAYPYNGHNLNPEPILKEKGAWVTQ
ncbi:transglycosylase SLT domain-containing protein [Rothia nasimurium]|uniref:transglycosylase SLT domain-containing protein n=1 Tax=Rothia nasimurium TaxID=85336 RepID=UPI001F234A00|nr:transglycosylase SLT domain-containing protein [Rothia nasimurium]